MKLEDMQAMLEDGSLVPNAKDAVQAELATRAKAAQEHIGAVAEDGIRKQIHLRFLGETTNKKNGQVTHSDKVYTLTQYKVGDHKIRLLAEFGRTGKATQDKVYGINMSLREADKKFNSLVQAKLKKGYEKTGGTEA